MDAFFLSNVNPFLQKSLATSGCAWPVWLDVWAQFQRNNLTHGTAGINKKQTNVHTWWC